VEKGGIDVIMRAMVAHGSSAAVQEAGCVALFSLAAKNAQNEVAIAAKGGIQAIVRAMAEHGPSTGVQEKGCWALFLMTCSDSGLCSLVLDAGAVPLVEKALSAFPDAALLQESGKNLLEKLKTAEEERFASLRIKYWTAAA